MRIEAFDYSTLDLLREHLALDFTNTAGTHSNPADNHLNSYADLVSWSHYVGLLNEADARHLLDLAARNPGEAAAAHQKAIAVREAIYNILSDHAAGQTPDAANLDTFNAALAEALPHLAIVPAKRGFSWTWADGEDHLERMLWLVIWSAAELMMSGDLKDVRECAADDCDWLFLDTSRNHSRRWCSMETCGNRAKARRHYHRAREEE